MFACSPYLRGSVVGMVDPQLVHDPLLSAPLLLSLLLLLLGIKGRGHDRRRGGAASAYKSGT